MFRVSIRVTYNNGSEESVTYKEDGLPPDMDIGQAKHTIRASFSNLMRMDKPISLVDLQGSIRLINTGNILSISIKVVPE